MRQSRWKFRLSVLSLGVTAALLPVTLTGDDGVSTATAECTTCCKDMEALCVKCAETCLVVQNAYDRGSGSCPVTPIAPNVPG